jgi:hypothetical protein
VRQEIAYQFAGNPGTDANVLYSDQEKPIHRVLGDEAHNLVKGVDQIGADGAPVVIAVDIFPPL